MRLEATGAGAGGGGGGGGAAWESAGGDFKAKLASITLGSRFYLRSRETDGASQAAVVLDTATAFSVAGGALLTALSGSALRFRIGSVGTLGVSIGLSGSSWNLDASVAIIPDLTGSEEPEATFCTGAPSASDGTAFLKVKGGSYLRLTSPRRPNLVISNPQRPMLNLAEDAFSVAFSTDLALFGQDIRATLLEPDTETAEWKAGNDDTGSGTGRARRGFHRAKSRKYASDLMPGCLVLQDKNGVAWYLWANSAAGQLRISSTDPRGNESSGSPV